jgi:hypothetical protein
LEAIRKMSYSSLQQNARPSICYWVKTKLEMFGLRAELQVHFINSMAS